MNKTRRRNITSAISKMNSALTILDGALDEECFAMDNYPENLQGSDVYLEMEESVDCLSNSVDLLRDAIDEVSEI